MQSPAPAEAVNEPLYEAFYGLREQPFALTTDPRFLYLSASHRRAHDELLTGLRRREGLLLLTGDVGTGKTTLARAVVHALGPRTFSALVLNPYMSDTEVLRVVLRDFGLVTRDEIRRGAFAAADAPQLLDTLEGFLRSLLPLTSYAVLIIDEAQSLAPRVLDQIRMLGGLEQDGQRLLQIVLAGQPPLAAALQTEAMRALEQRISRRVTLGPLQPSDVDGYIRHRLSVAGSAGAVSFSPEAVAAVMTLSEGIPRRINLLCDRALEHGRIQNSNLIGPEFVQRAARALSGPDRTAGGGDPPPSKEASPVPPAEPARTGELFTLGGRRTPARRRRRWLWAVLPPMLVAAGAAAAGVYLWRSALVQATASLPAPPATPLMQPAPPDAPSMPTDQDLAKFEPNAGGG